jgi:hypothetical protein
MNKRRNKGQGAARKLQRVCSPRKPVFRETTMIIRSVSQRLLLCVVICFVSLVSPLLHAQPAGSIAEVTGGMDYQAGFVPFYWDSNRGRVLIEIPVFDEDVLYYVSAATGGGSVELGLDRGIMTSKVIHFVRSGPRVLVEEQNTTFRALGGTALRAANVTASFPTSILAALPIEAVEDDRVLVDATSLFMRDAGEIELELRGTNQGSMRLDPARSAFYPARMKAFVDNTEIETIMTYSIEGAGVVVRNVVPDQRTLSLHIHHSFLRAPTGYKPRVADTRIGVSTLGFNNFAAPIDQGIEQQWITRWRLEKKDPTAAMSEPVQPIVFWLDPAIPDDIREAMRLGTLWWNEAFEAAGFINAVEVRDPTPDMDPMDIRYAWVQWIERDERGFSSGGTFRDPRTGEILGSKTRMDSHRIRTIANYWESYMVNLPDGEHGMPDGQYDMTLLRQSLLVAHELGHVLGFQHNWASSINDRASVMEYPTPRVSVVDGRLDLSESFMTAIGEYDKYMVRYAYTPLEDATEMAGLDGIIQAMRADGLLYVPDTDPRWAWYDDLATPTEYLRETMAAREIMVASYGLDNLDDGEPVGALRDMRLWMGYLHHRWAIEAAQRYVGGMYHNFVLKGEDLPVTEIVPASLQREILALLMEAITPANLALPESLLQLLAPHPGRNLEDLSGNYAFDQLQAARILSAMVVEPLLAPDRTARMVAFATRDPDTLTLAELVETLLANSWNTTLPADPYAAALLRINQSVVMQGMMMLGKHEETTPEVRAYILDQLALLGDSLASRRSREPMTQAHYRQAARDIERYLADPPAFEDIGVMPLWGSRPRSRYPLPPGPPL